MKIKTAALVALIGVCLELLGRFYYIFNAIKFIELIRINAYRGHPHTAAHYSNIFIFILSGKRKHIPYRINTFNIIKIKYISDYLTHYVVKDAIA